MIILLKKCYRHGAPKQEGIATYSYYWYFYDCPNEPSYGSLIVTFTEANPGQKLFHKLV